MHVLIGLLTAIGGLIWALYRLHNSGVNLNSFNPFYWVRRKQWEKQLGTRPLHRLTKPMEAAAVLVVAIAKMEGEITREQKAEVIGLFEREFKLSASAAGELYSISCHLLRETVNYSGEIKNILAPCKARFNSERRESLMEMLKRIAEVDSLPSKNQMEFIDAVDTALRVPPIDQGDW